MVCPFSFYSVRVFTSLYILLPIVPPSLELFSSQLSSHGLSFLFGVVWYLLLKTSFEAFSFKSLPIKLFIFESLFDSFPEGLIQTVL